MPRPGEPMSASVPTKTELWKMLRSAWETGRGFCWPNSLTFDDWCRCMRTGSDWNEDPDA